MLPLKVLLNSLGWALGGLLAILILAQVYVTIIKTLTKYSGENLPERPPWYGPYDYEQYNMHHPSRRPYHEGDKPFGRQGQVHKGSYNGSVEAGQLRRPPYPGEMMNLTNTTLPKYPNKSDVSTQDQEKDYEEYGATAGPEDTSSSPYLFQPIRYQNVVKRSAYREYKDG